MGKCHFLGGIITFEFDFLIKTTEKTNLLVRGAPNFFIDGVHPLEGLVETDWLNFSFTMNWKVTQPNKLITFKKGDPICFIQPIPHDYSETFQFEIDYLENNIEMSKAFAKWSRERIEFTNNRKLGLENRAWQKDYFDGSDLHDGTKQDKETHSTKLHLSDPVDQKLPSNSPSVKNKLEIIK